MTEKKKDVLRSVDDAARRLGKTLLRTARFASLATL
ncbi:MAG: HugZ family protein, partial [Hyphomicrobium sp.]